MERKANYVLIGLFTFAAIAAAFAFVFWVHYTSDKKQGVAYRVIFDGAVSGLRVGSSVLFNGIRVGEVTALRLNADSPTLSGAVLATSLYGPDGGAREPRVPGRNRWHQGSRGKVPAADHHL